MVLADPEDDLPTCFDHFHLDHFNLHAPPRRRSRSSAGFVDGFHSLCRTPFQRDRPDEEFGAHPTVRLLPGVEALDLYAQSALGEIWKDGQTTPCLVPQSVVGWEFHTLLWPQPSGASPLKLDGAIDVLIGRPSGAQVCPSVLFAFIPSNHLHAASRSPTTSAARGNVAPTGLGPQGHKVGFIDHTAADVQEEAHDNLDLSLRTRSARLVVLSPGAIFKSPQELASGQHWGLFITPRSRTLALLHHQRGRVDLHLAIAFTLDASFRLCGNLVGTIAKLFAPFGTADRVPALLDQPDPLKIHSGLTNAVAVDHMSIQADGRKDYQHFFGISLPAFFLSNASNNLCFLTPSEAQQLRLGDYAPAPQQTLRLPDPSPLPDLPVWVLQGRMGETDLANLHRYRARWKQSHSSLTSAQASSELLGTGILQQVCKAEAGAFGTSLRSNLFNGLSCNGLEGSDGHYVTREGVGRQFQSDPTILASQFRPGAAGSAQPQQSLSFSSPSGLQSVGPYANDPNALQSPLAVADNDQPQQAFSFRGPGGSQHYGGPCASASPEMVVNRYSASCGDDGQVMRAQPDNQAWAPNYGRNLDVRYQHHHPAIPYTQQGGHQHYRGQQHFGMVQMRPQVSGVTQDHRIAATASGEH